MTTYTGDVTPGGPSDVRDLGVLTLRKVSVGSMDNNVYLLTCNDTGCQLLVDAAAEPNRLIDLVEEGSGRLGGIVTTHRHGDHVGALEELTHRTGVPTYAGENDADALPVAPDHRLAHGDTITFGEVTLDVVELRGHTPGAIALTWKDADGQAHAITGDSLFPGGPGKTPSPEDFASLMDDLESRIFEPLDDDTWVYPGHGKDTTLGAERPHLAEWRERGW
ncbi:MBL fold metallo-hydrolase [Mobilicoccus massiliensis]|uniref:MBL fold metallo-hydrolase n=1 Tax=Mobilicoccus massiliensis TaxID=1522310 RepID=UPI000590A7FA|nr:MBL fold metallo-hydrolase [Mobilicoccus massiliensis]